MRASKRLLILPAVAALLLAGYLSVLAQPSPSDGGGQLGSVTGQRWAVLVGVNQYAELNNLAYCVADAKALRDRLVKAGFPERNVFLLVDGAEDSGALPFRRNIQREIAGVLQSAEEDDLVLISFSGHGMHIDGKSYFCPSDASADSPETTMIPLDLIYRQLEQSAAGQKILLVDACRNDPRPIGPRTLEEKKEYQRSLERLGEQLRRPPEGTAVLSSSAPGQISWEDPKLGHGVFLYYVLEGLDGKAADAEGQVSLLDLWRYANRQTRSFVLHHRRGYVQTPELRGAITGDMVLARLPMRVEPVKPPPPLAVGPATGQRWAVLVGVNEYAELEDLRYCVADVRALRDRLVASGFPEENVFLLVDDAPRQVDRPFRANIQQRIESMLKVAGKDDLVLVAFRGHGAHIDGKSYFCPADANLDSPETTMVPVALIYRLLEASAARQKLLLVDVSQHGPQPLASQLNDSPPKGVAVLSSAGPGQNSWEDKRLGHGVFMYYVLEGLAGKADEAGNRDGLVSLPELYDYAYLQTVRWGLFNRPGRRNLQTPALTAQGVGSLEDWHLTRQAVPR